MNNSLPLFIGVMSQSLIFHLFTFHSISTLHDLVNHQTEVIVMLAHAQLDIPYDYELLNEEGVE